MYEQNIALFLYEIAYLITPIIREEFVEQLNDFIRQEYLENKNTFNVLFVPDLLDELFNDGYQPLPFDYIMELYEKYKGIDAYAQLVENAGPKTDKTINNLVLKFLKYMQVIAKLYYQEPNGYPKVLS